MQEYTIARVGDRPLKFRAELISSGTSQRPAGERQRKRWHEISIYETAGKKWVAHVLFKSRDTEESRAHVADSSAQLAELLRKDVYADSESYRAAVGAALNRAEFVEELA